MRVKDLDIRSAVEPETAPFNTAVDSRTRAAILSTVYLHTYLHVYATINFSVDSTVRLSQKKVL